MASKELEAQFESFFVEYGRKREARGWMPLEASHLVHMRNAWFASRESVEIDLPDTVANTGTLTSGAVLSYKRECREALEAQGLKVKP